jgi:hypothetical protein
LWKRLLIAKWSWKGFFFFWDVVFHTRDSGFIWAGGSWTRIIVIIWIL